MSNDIEGLERFICAYDKKLDAIGDQEFIDEFRLDDIDIDALRDIFAVSPEEEDPLVQDLILPLKVDAEQAAVLQEFVKGTVIDTNKYDYYLETYQAEGFDWSEDDIDESDENEESIH